MKFVTLLSSKVRPRAEVRDGKSYTVVPVVALVEGVIKALNSEGPEFVGAEVFSELPDRWNGRPVFVDHPMVDGVPVSGNSPAILATKIGTIFNSTVKDEKLTMEAWLEDDKLSDELKQRIAEGDPIEISVGATVNIVAEGGEYNGKTFTAKWTNLHPDHLALLSKGKTGACSVKSGCGVRAAQGQKVIDLTAASAFAEAVDAFRIAMPAADMSDNDRRSAIQKELQKTVTGAYVEAVYADEGTVVYCVYPPAAIPSCGCSGSAPAYTGPQYFEIDFEVSKDGVVTLGTETTEVEPVLRYLPVAKERYATEKDPKTGKYYEDGGPKNSDGKRIKGMPSAKVAWGTK